MGILGRIKGWITNAPDMSFKLAGEIRQGLAQDETNTQIINRVKIATGISERNAAALVHTSVQTAANEARLASFRANSDVIAGLTWMATLDQLTCSACAARDGMEWDLDGKPVNNGIPFQSPPLHVSCRCILTPRTRTFKELGIDLPDFPAGPRATAGGPVYGTFDDFLHRQGKAYQDEIFGPGRADLYRRGVITRSQLLDQDGNELTLEQLKQNYE